jgi:acetyl esterase/lipase
MTPEEIETLSPIRHIYNRDIPCQIYVGGAELPELRRQSADYAEALTAAGRPAELTLPEGRDHFTVVDELARPDGILARGLNRLVAL